MTDELKDALEASSVAHYNLYTASITLAKAERTLRGARKHLDGAVREQNRAQERVLEIYRKETNHD